MTRTEAAERLEACILPEWAMLPDFGLYMDQLVTYVGNCFKALEGRLDLTASMINNYVKAGLIERPSGKKYSRASLAQLLMIALLKPTTPLDVLKELITPGEDGSIESVYSAFRAQQKAVLGALRQREEDSPLSCALEASSLQLLVGLRTPDARRGK